MQFCIIIPHTHPYFVL